MSNRALLILVLGLLVCAALAVDRSKFKTCDQAGFCHRLRSKNAAPSPASAGSWSLAADSVEFVSRGVGVEHEFTGLLKHSVYTAQPPLRVHIELLANGVVRTRMVESSNPTGRFSPPDVLQPAGVAPLSAEAIASGFKLDAASNEIRASLVGNTLIRVAVAPAPFALHIERDGAPLVSVNERNLFAFEQHRAKHPAPAEYDPVNGPHPLDFPYDGPNFWEESFGSHSDTKPKGPSGIAMDFSFHGSEHVYGLPEHATSLSLKNTIGENSQYSQPYRLYNLDVFEFELNEPMSLYGAIPFLMSHATAKRDAAVFWLNAAETFIDISSVHDANGAPRKDAHFISESGMLDFFILTGRAPSDLFAHYAALTGHASMPQMFAIAYHQCRWNYRDDADVRAVDGGFDEHDIPYDVLWLDIEHTDGKRYFTWDKGVFPDPVGLQNALAAKGRNMVTIIDPHIKKDSNYAVYQKAHEQNDYFVKTHSGNEFDGWCWPGSSAYLDFTSPVVRQYWASLFALDKYPGSTMSLYTWNDMNEPSVFNGPETTMQKDNLHHGGVEHRDVHNMYGFYQHMATAAGQLERSGGKTRPFVLSRSFFAGSQRHGPIWTGDNLANWEHLASSLPMLMSLNIAGYSFVGADVGGFFKDPEPELLVRWYQAGAYQPFFRGHSHIDTKRREPWLFGDSYTALIRQAIRSRYAMLPYLYTTFHANSAAAAGAMPVMRPMFVHYPEDASLFGVEDQYLLGEDLLVKPVTKPGQTSTTIILPGSQPWYDIDSAQSHIGGQTTTVQTPIHKIPVMQRGGSIVTRKERVRRSSKLMAADPYTLVVALDLKGAAKGRLYVDDGASFEFQHGSYAWREFSFENNQFQAKSVATASNVVGSAVVAPASSSFTVPNTIERIVLMGLKSNPTRITLTQGGQSRALEFLSIGGRLVIRKPDINVLADFTITLA